MASIDYPPGLPVAHVGTLEGGYNASYISDESEVGAPRRRKRFTRTLRRFSYEQGPLTDTQAATLRTFIETATDGGTLAFNWTHPITATAYEVRFVELPTMRQLTLGAWGAAITLEEI